MGVKMTGRSVESGGFMRSGGNFSPTKKLSSGAIAERAKRPGVSPIFIKKSRKKPQVHTLGREKLVPPTELEKIAGVETVDAIRSRAALEDAGVIEKGAPLPSLPIVNAVLIAQAAQRRAQEKLAKKADELAQRMQEREAQRLREKWTDQTPTKGNGMTVSLYKSMASGAMEVVVQTNAQSIDIFIAALADALHAALVHEASAPNAVDNSQALIAATLKNAFPVAYAISGYKAEKVSESKLLTCGFASPDASELLAQSKQ